VNGVHSIVGAFVLSHARTSADCAELREIMAREVASTRIPGNESRMPNSEPPVVSPPPAVKPVGAVPVAKGKFLRPMYLVPHRLTPAERHRRISDLAYKRAEQRGFAPGNETEDWLDAEREVDAGRY
jgi:Protein of unknown function (DUF2934)